MEKSDFWDIFVRWFFFAILLVLPIEEISLQPELSSPPCFRIQGGSLSVTEEKDGRKKSLCLI